MATEDQNADLIAEMVSNCLRKIRRREFGGKFKKQFKRLVIELRSRAKNRWRLPKETSEEVVHLNSKVCEERYDLK